MNIIELFCGCGGLAEGFLKNEKFNTIACVDWDKNATNILKHRIKTKYPHKNEEIVITKDIQDLDELMSDTIDQVGLSTLTKNLNIDMIIGGPPCQAYSIAGRIRDKQGMKYDYRNYLFESYLEVVKKFSPSFFIFENVPGIFSAKPGDGSKKIIEDIEEKFSQAGYKIYKNKKTLLVDMDDYGVPQKRTRAIILGVNQKKFNNADKILEKFYYEILPSYKEQKKTVRDSISDLPKLIPSDQDYSYNKKKYSHHFNKEDLKFNHSPRYHNRRDMEIFKILAEDIKFERYKYINTKSLIEFYYEMTGKRTNVHKYHVLRWDEPSNTIPAHLYKDGLRHIHPDPEQARTITVREAARLQSFPDDFEFISGTNKDYMYIGNAVPPKFSEKLANAVSDLLDI